MGWARRAAPLLLSLATIVLGVPAAQAAGTPEVTATWTTTVTASSANLRAEINPRGQATSYRFEYSTSASFAGAKRAPLVGEGSAGSGEAPLAVVQHIGGLAAATTYHYRVVATNVEGPTTGPARALRTQEAAPVFVLPDSRGWEMVSPVDKNGGDIAPPESLFGGGVLQAAAQGGAVTYGSAASFATAQGAPGASQYLSRREAGGWSTENVTVPLLAGGYPSGATSGVPYQLFSTDLSSALLSNGKRCRGDATACPVANPPLPGSGAPAGYRDYYRRNSAAGSYAALLHASDLSAIEPQDFEAFLAGASADLGQVVLSSCSALSANANEVPGPGSECDPAAQNLYLLGGGAPTLINLLPAAGQGTPGATLAGAGGAGALSASRAFFNLNGNLYLREGTQTVQVDESVGGGGTFQAAAGSVAYFSKAGHLYRYASGTAADLTPAGGLLGVLGTSADGSHVYYLTSSGLFLWNVGTVTEVASSADASDYPPATGTARVSADGSRLLFASSASLVEYESAGASEVYLYSATAKTLSCLSCNPTGERPLGPSSVPGAVANGTAIDTYKPRALSADGTRVFFDSSDALLPRDSNKEPDVYEWEQGGAGSCTNPSGCLSLISSGDSSEGARFVDASTNGDDVFFLTNGSLVGSDHGAIDLYDARVGGGFPSAEPPIPCIGDACQQVPGQAEDPALATSVGGARGNPPLNIPTEKTKRKKKKHKHKKHAKHKKNGGRR